MDAVLKWESAEVSVVQGRSLHPQLSISIPDSTYDESIPPTYTEVSVSSPERGV